MIPIILARLLFHADLEQICGLAILLNLVSERVATWPCHYRQYCHDNSWPTWFSGSWSLLIPLQLQISYLEGPFFTHMKSSPIFHLVSTIVILILSFTLISHQSFLRATLSTNTVIDIGLVWFKVQKSTNQAPFTILFSGYCYNVKSMTRFGVELMMDSKFCSQSWRMTLLAQICASVAIGLVTLCMVLQVVFKVAMSHFLPLVLLVLHSISQSLVCILVSILSRVIEYPVPIFYTIGYYFSITSTIGSLLLFCWMFCTTKLVSPE